MIPWANLRVPFLTDGAMKSGMASRPKGTERTVLLNANCVRLILPLRMNSGMRSSGKKEVFPSDPMEWQIAHGKLQMANLPFDFCLLPFAMPYGLGLCRRSLQSAL